MRSHPEFDLAQKLWLAAGELRAIGLHVVFYIGILTLLVIGAITLWNGLPDALAQAHSVAVTAGWAKDPPPLRGSL